MSQPGPEGELPKRRRPAPEKLEVRPPSAETLRRRRLIATIAAAVIGVAVVILVLVLINRPDPEPTVLEPVPGETVTAPVPTASLAPIERDTSTAFLAALPSTVLQWAVVDQQVPQGILDEGALEAYTLVYADGPVDDDPSSLVLSAAQWRSPEAAAGHLASLGLPGEPVASQEVLVAGAAVGTMTTYPDVDGSGASVAWSNGATTFVARAPGETATTFYDAFGM
ncbi:hypothetical protein C8046_15790 [Serinibacter arcticus]|uniref:Uncharacterized protein n=1 Tax=Serinibacter arcticus TaxID=1655435 RepID=A0A2U1ZY22_9MICO|nr:hypothetical protein [Serinibacter arcticus]PWD51886.1 hypothetical protein C8046_15790 [Serinibacter arcticus]